MRSSPLPSTVVPNPASTTTVPHEVPARLFGNPHLAQEAVRQALQGLAQLTDRPRSHLVAEHLFVLGHVLLLLISEVASLPLMASRVWT